jgi:Mn2+/Fe2+ NRAMP family transporter
MRNGSIVETCDLKVKKNANKERKNDKDILLNDKQISKSSSTKETLKSLGPGLITGASDDDPSGIATFSQAGAQFGFGMLWMALFQYPMMTVIQEMCARIGLVTGSGLGRILKKKYSKKILFHFLALCLLQIQ